MRKVLASFAYIAMIFVAFAWPMSLTAKSDGPEYIYLNESLGAESGEQKVFHIAACNKELQTSSLYKPGFCAEWNYIAQGAKRWGVDFTESKKTKMTRAKIVRGSHIAKMMIRKGLCNKDNSGDDIPESMRSTLNNAIPIVVCSIQYRIKGHKGLTIFK